MQLQLTREQNRFELGGSTDMRILFDKYSIVNVFSYDFLNFFPSSLLDFKNIVYNIYNIQNVC